MAHAYAFQSEALTAQDISVLHLTLNRWCREVHIEMNDPRAEEAAAELIDWFQFGLRHEDQLIEMLRRG